MKKLTALPLFLALCVSCASSPPGPAGTSATEVSNVIVTTDPHSVIGCRLITRTIESYDIRDPERKRRLQEEAARRGGNTVLISIKGDRKGEVFSCPAPAP